MDIQKYTESQFHNQIRKVVMKAEAMRADNERPVDVSFAAMLKKEHKGVSIDDFYQAIGVDPGFDTISNLFTVPDEDVRWLVPELFRDALRLGYRQAPIWPSLTAMEEQVSGLSQILPSINMSDATPKRVGEGETIPVGTLSYQSKKVEINKFGRGIKLPDEVVQYVNLNVVATYLQDFGVKMGLGVDTLALDVLINGEQSDGSEAAPVIGIKTPNTLVFRDILKVWIRMSKIGRKPNLMVGGEDMALDTLDLEEFSKTPNVAPSEYRLNLKTPLPQGADYYIHGNVADDQELIVDSSSSIIKLNAQPLKVESERIVSNQTQAFYASFTLGFAKLFTDACLILDRTLDFADNGFPAQMDIYDFQNVDMNG